MDQKQLTPDEILNPQDYETTRSLTLVSEDERAIYAEGLEDDAPGETQEDAAPAPEELETQEDTPPADPPARAIEVHEIPEDVLIGDALDAKIEALKAERSAAMKAYEDLEINADELSEKLDAVTVEMIDLTKAAEHHTALRERDLKAIADAEQEVQQSLEQKWQDTVKAYSDQYPALFAPGVVEHFDDLVRRVTAASEMTPEKLDEFLVDAHTMLHKRQEKLGITVPDLAEPGAAPPRKQPAPPKSDLGTVPRTLARVPAAQAMPADDSRFASLNEIVQGTDAAALEAAAAKLPTAEYDRWLAEG